MTHLALKEAPGVEAVLALAPTPSNTCFICGEEAGGDRALCPRCEELEEEDRRAWEDELLQKHRPL